MTYAYSLCVQVWVVSAHADVCGRVREYVLCVCVCVYEVGVQAVGRACRLCGACDQCTWLIAAPQASHCAVGHLEVLSEVLLLSQQ